MFRQGRRNEFDRLPRLRNPSGQLGIVNGRQPSIGIKLSDLDVTRILGVMEMKRIFVFLPGCCLMASLMASVMIAPECHPLTDQEMASLFGGDQYDDFAVCDGTTNCTACVAPTCTTGPLNCVTMIAGNDGCANSSGTDSFCKSNSLWSDCEYKGGVQVCGGPANRRSCGDMIDYPSCQSWGEGKAGCQAGTISIEQCQNCATIP